MQKSDLRNIDGIASRAQDTGSPTGRIACLPPPYGSSTEAPRARQQYRRRFGHPQPLQSHQRVGRLPVLATAQRAGPRSTPPRRRLTPASTVEGVDDTVESGPHGPDHGKQISSGHR